MFDILEVQKIFFLRLPKIHFWKPKFLNFGTPTQMFFAKLIPK